MYFVPFVYRPYVVSADWIAACYHAGETVSEEAYCCLELPSVDVTTPKARWVEDNVFEFTGVFLLPMVKVIASLFIFTETGS